MHLVGFIIRIFHDARSPERQIKIKVDILTKFFFTHILCEDFSSTKHHSCVALFYHIPYVNISLAVLSVRQRVRYSSLRLFFAASLWHFCGVQASYYIKNKTKNALARMHARHTHTQTPTHKLGYNVSTSTNVLKTRQTAIRNTASQILKCCVCNTSFVFKKRDYD